MAYYVLQIVGAFTSFYVFGSGAGGNDYALLLPILMVCLQLLTIYLLSRRVEFLKDNKVIFILFLVTIVLFAYNYFSPV